MRTNTLVSKGPQPTTLEGAKVARIGAYEQLRRSVLSCLLWEGSFYESGETVADRIASLAAEVDPRKLAGLAIDARMKHNLRHVPLWLVRAMARRKDCSEYVASTLAGVIRRADELSEFMSLYFGGQRQPLTRQVRKGLAAAFLKFDEYSLSKYDRANTVRLRDVLFLCHAKPGNAEQADLWKRLIDNKLTVPDTWEVALSGGADKKETFERLIREGKLGYDAALKNLRNMREAGCDEKLVADRLMDSKGRDRVLPFRFIAAAKAVPQWEPMIEPAMLAAVDGMPKLAGKTALVIDTSPSMWQSKISDKSDLDRFDAAAALAILARSMCESVNVYTFNTKAYVIPPRHGFALRDAMLATKGGYSCGGLAVAQANKDGYDRIIVLTDGQWHVMADGREAVLGRQPVREDEATKVSPPPLTKRAYMINVATRDHGVGYGPWTTINGFSEATLDYVRACEAEPVSAS